MQKVPIVNESPYDLPEYATSSSAGVDLRAAISSEITLEGFISKKDKIIFKNVFLHLNRILPQNLHQHTFVLTKHC